MKEFEVELISLMEAKQTNSNLKYNEEWDDRDYGITRFIEGRNMFFKFEKGKIYPPRK